MTSPFLKSILLVDDDEISNLFNKIFIEKLNLDVSVDCVANGSEALDLIVSSEDYATVVMPCLLLLDIKMPIMNGWEFLKAFQKQISTKTQSEITIVMLTTSEDEGDKIRAVNDPNVREYIQKPLSEETITMLIRKYYPKTVISS
jgi:CheY-like chemotaxis protein